MAEVFNRPIEIVFTKPLNPDPNKEYHWLEYGQDGNIDYKIQKGAGPDILTTWHGRRDGFQHLRQLIKSDSEALPEVPVEMREGHLRLVVLYDENA